MKYVFLTFLLSIQSVIAQTDFVGHHRKWLVGSGTAALSVGSISVLASVWYDEYPKSAFHSFDDSREWLQMDKLGHAYTANFLTSSQYHAWRWAGMSKKKSLWLAGGISWSYLLGIEVLDGFNEEWGFSFSDLSANTVGTGLFIVQQQIWDEQRIHLKFGYKPSQFAELRPNTLGSNWSERLLKDYNAQSYWIAAAPTRFTNYNRFRWLQLAVGYSVHEKLFGSENSAVFNGVTYLAKREWALGFDIDWSQLPVKRPWLKKSLRLLNAVKVPLPAVFWRSGTCYVGIL